MLDQLLSKLAPRVTINRVNVYVGNIRNRE